MLHNFQMAAREAGLTMKEYRADPQKAARAHIQAAEKYDTDGVLIDMDTATLAGAVGVPVDLPADEPARTRGGLLVSLDGMDRLHSVQVKSDERINIWLETCTIVKSYFGEEKCIRGNCDQAPFSLASMIREPGNWMVDLVTHPEQAHELLGICTEITSQFIGLMAETGVDMVSNGDSPAGPEMISPDQYLEFAWPYEKEVVEFAHALDLPYILHICGNTDLILERMVQTGADGLELDQKTDIRRIREVLGGRCALFGNIDPVHIIHRGSPEDVEQAVGELAQHFREEPRFILNAGCAIPADAPPENIYAMIKALKND
jgi:uroporphyrinogen decarboxylase